MGASPRCGCETCTEEVWNTFAGPYTCGDRIAFMRDSDVATLENVGIFTGPYDEEGACQFVSDEFPDICTCSCDEPSSDEDEPSTESPTVSPTSSPTQSPTTSDECVDSPLDARVNKQPR